MTDNALAAPGRVIRATTKGLGFPRKRQLWAITLGDDQEAIAHFKWVFPEFEAVEIVGDFRSIRCENWALSLGTVFPYDEQSALPEAPPLGRSWRSARSSSAAP